MKNVAVQQPRFDAKNMQGFFRLGANLGGQDIALSYYRGFNDIPQATSTRAYQIREEICENPGDYDLPPEERVGDCVDGVIANDVVLGFPRHHVLGFNMSGEFGIGYRVELGVFFPEGATRNPVTQDDIRFGNPLGDDVVEDGPYNFPGDADGTVVENTPFAKWTVGLDYTFGKHVMLIGMWVHGFPDEYGAGDYFHEGYAVRASDNRPGAVFGDCVSITSFNPLVREVDGRKCAREWYKPRLSDYAILGLDVNFAAQRGLFRLFTIWDVTGVYDRELGPGRRRAHARAPPPVHEGRLQRRHLPGHAVEVRQRPRAPRRRPPQLRQEVDEVRRPRGRRAPDLDPGTVQLLSHREPRS